MHITDEKNRNEFLTRGSSMVLGVVEEREYISDRTEG